MQNNIENKNNSIGVLNSGFIFFAFISLYFFISSLGQILLSALNIGQTAQAFIAPTFSLISAVIIILIYCKTKRVNIAKATRITKFNPLYILPSILLAFGMLFAFGSVNNLLAELITKLGGKVSGANPPLDSALQLILCILIIGLLVAVIEEGFFRGLMLSRLSGAGAVASALTVSLIFALYHANIIQLIYQFIYGVALCYLTIKSGSSIPAMIAHFINNAFILICGYFTINIDLSSIYIILSGVVMLGGFCALCYLFNRKKEITATESIKAFYLPYGILAIIFLILVIVLGVIL